MSNRLTTLRVPGGIALWVAALLPAALLVGLCPARLSAQAIERTVEFRDGTVLKVKLPNRTLAWKRVYPNGAVEDAPVALDQVALLRIVDTPATEQAEAIRRLVLQLADDNYHRREQAQAELLLSGRKFRGILKQSREDATDFEQRWRLDEILKALHEGTALLESDFDALTLASGAEVLQGEAANFELTADYRGQPITLTRENVRALRQGDPGVALAIDPTASSAERIDDDDRNFPDDVVRIDFDQGPRGESLDVGQDIGKVYVAKGCTMRSLIDGAIVSVEQYNVGGRSGGRCAATHEPLYQGEIEIRFCLPGNENAPAGVTSVGCYVSFISPGGTGLQAYDVLNRLITEVKTVNSSRDFLGIKSERRIAYVRLVPYPEIDKDYAFDDLTFDPPRPLAEAGVPDRYSVVLTSGERMSCQALDNVNGAAVLKNVSVGLDELQLPLDELAVIVPPQHEADALSPALERCNVRLLDGSILRAMGGEGLKCVRFPELAFDVNQIVALWGAKTQVVEPKEELMELPFLVQGDNRRRPLRDLKLGPRWVESESLTADDNQTYETSPVIWLQNPTERAATDGLLRLASGDELVLKERDGFVLQSWSAEGVAIAHGDKAWTIPLAEVSTLVFPR